MSNSKTTTTLQREKIPLIITVGITNGTTACSAYTRVLVCVCTLLKTPQHDWQLKASQLCLEGSDQVFILVFYSLCHFSPANACMHTDKPAWTSTSIHAYISKINHQAMMYPNNTIRKLLGKCWRVDLYKQWANLILTRQKCGRFTL